jgi:hypothetical protein
MELGPKSYEIRGKVFNPTPKPEKKEDESKSERPVIKLSHYCELQKADIDLYSDDPRCRPEWKEVEEEKWAVKLHCPNCPGVEEYDPTKENKKTG